MKILLKEGDVIRIENGMNIYANIPEMFVFHNSFSDKLITYEVMVGKEYSNKKEASELFGASDTFKEDISSTVVSKCAQNGFCIDYEKVLDFVRNNIYKPELNTFRFTGGRFLVVSTTNEIDNHWNPLSHINSYRVFCKRLKDGKYDENGDEISFYQSGCSSAMITDIATIATMKAKYE